MGSLASLVSSTCAQLVLLVTLLALCFFRSRQAQVLGISAGMEQKDSSIRALVVIPSSGMCKAGFTGDCAPRAISLPSCCPAQMLGIIAGMEQTDSFVATWCSSSRSSTFPSRRRGRFPQSFSSGVWIRWPTMKSLLDTPVESPMSATPGCRGR